MIARYVVHYNIEDVLSRKISEYRSDLIKNNVLIDKENLPLHCTLFAFNSDESNESEIIKKMYDINLSAKYLIPKHSDVFFHNMLVLRLERTPELHHDHKTAINTLYPFVFHDIELSEEIKPYVFTQNQRESYSKYGSPFFGVLYNPHISIGTLFNHNLLEVTNHKNFFGHEQQTIKYLALSKKENHDFKTLFSNIKS